MYFEPIRSSHGQPSMQCNCGSCDRKEVVSAVRGKHGGDAEGAAVARIQKQGWTYIGKRLRCPICEAKRKVAKVTKNKKAVSVVQTAPREPTRAQKRAILDLLEDVYDTESSRYSHSETDDTVADFLNVMPGWVIQLREEFYGPAGKNEDMSALAADVNAFLEPARLSLLACQKQSTAVAAEIKKAENLLKRLAGIERAVGPRVMAQVK